MNISIKKLPDLQVAYVRRIGSYFEPQNHWGELMQWAVENRLFPPQNHFIGISLDNPNLVEANSCRHDACVTVSEGFATEKHHKVQFKTIDGGLYALYSFYDIPEKLNLAYQFMFEQWLPNAQFAIDYDRCNLEFNRNNPIEDPEGKCKIDLYVPIIEIE